MDLPTPASSPVSAARSLGPYQLHESLGMGPRGTVYRAIDSRSGQEIAVKVFAPEVIPTDARPEMAVAEGARVEALLEGARQSQRLKQPSIVPVLDVGVEGGNPYFARGFIRGVPIDRWARGAVYNPAFTTPANKGTSRPSGIGPAFGPPPGLPDILATLYHVCRAVDAAHEQGLMHGNLRPENVLVDADGRPHLTDFALPPDLPPPEGTDSRAILGGVPFHAPEVLLRKAGQPRPARDIYSLGAILYTLLTDHPPFDDPDPDAVMQDATRRRWSPPSARKPSVHQDLDAICAKAMAASPERRFASVKDLANALDRFLHHERLALELTAGEALLHAVTRPWVVGLICVGVVVTGLAFGALLRGLSSAREELDRTERRQALLRQAEQFVAMEEQTSWRGATEPQLRAALGILDRARPLGECAEGDALRARALRAVGDWKGARDDALAALALDPRNADALRIRAEAAVRRAWLEGGWPESVCRWAATEARGGEEPPPFPRGEHVPDLRGTGAAEVRESLSAVVAVGARQDHVAWARGLLAWMQGDLAAARARFDEGIELCPSLQMLRTARGALSLAEGKGPEACADLEVAAHGAPPSAEAQLLLAIACGLVGDGKAAIADLEEAQRTLGGWGVASRVGVYLRVLSGDLAQAGECAKALVRADDTAEAHLLLAWTAALAGDPAVGEAIAQSTQRWASDPSLEYFRVWLLARRGDLPGAMRALGDLLTLCPDMPEALYLSATVHLQLDEGEGALSACERALAKCPTWRAPRVTRVRALISLDREEEGLLSVEDVLAGAPGDAAFLSLKAQAYLHRARRRRDAQLKAKDLDSALRAADQAIAASPHGAAPLLLRASVHDARGEDAGAEADFAAAAKAEPASAEPLRARVAWLLGRGRHEEALRLLDPATSRADADPDLVRKRAAAYAALGRKQKALADLDRFVASRPYDAQALAERGRLCLELGEKEKGRQDLSKALELGRYRHDMGAVRDLLESIH